MVLINIIGEPMIWDETCRIKHLPTRMYLAVKKREKESGQSSNFDQYQVQFATTMHMMLSFKLIICGKIYPPLQSTLVSMNSSDYKQLTIFKLFPVIHQVISQQNEFNYRHMYY